MLRRALDLDRFFGTTENGYDEVFELEISRVYRDTFTQNGKKRINKKTHGVD
jgi:hypothetical protein